MRHRRLAISLALALVLGAASPSRADESLLLSRPAADAVPVGAGLAVLAPDLRGVSLLDRRGQRRWHRALPAGAPRAGRLALVGAGERVAVLRDDLALLVEGASGELRGAPVAGAFAAGAARGCALVERGGACAIDCPCAFQVVHCGTLAPLGPRFSLPELPGAAPSDDDEAAPPEAACSGRRGVLVGRAGELVIASVPGPRDVRGSLFAAPQVVGLRAADGAVVWGSTALGAVRAEASLSGVAAGGRGGGVGALDGRVEAFDCATGAGRWSARGALPRGSEPQADRAAPAGAGPEGLLVRVREGVERRRLADGRVVWRIDAPSERVVADGVGGAAWPVRLGASEAVRVVDPASGATRASFTVAAGAAGGVRELAPAGEGWLVVAGRELVRHDRSGRAAARHTAGALTQWAVGESAVALRTREALTLVDAERLLPVFELGGASATLVGLEGALGRGIVAVMVHAGRAPDPADPDTLSELRLIRFRDGGS